MAIVPIDSNAPADGPGTSGGSERTGQLKQAGHLKDVPALRTDRERIREAAASRAASLDKTRPLRKPQIEEHARAVLVELGLAENYLGWTMVVMGTAFWRDQVVSIPIPRRLLLLPHCLRNAEVCQAEYNELGLLCEDCGACPLTELRSAAEEKGYQVLIAEGSPIVLQLILGGETDAVLGIGCLNSLEKALDKLLLVGLPAMAVPLFGCTCRNTSTDHDWVYEMIDTPHEPGVTPTETRVHLLRCAARMFDPDQLEQLVPRLRSGRTLAESNGEGLSGLDPMAATEALAHDFLARGGKHFRPFITLSAYDAMTGGSGTGPNGDQSVANLPDAVKRVALAIEVFHKASLVHDDIEDDDAFRYGRPALHRKYGVPAAINVGDYMIGLGYRLVASGRNAISPDVVADILVQLSEAHTRLCEGQGAELAWRDALDKRLTPIETLKIYALKTAPAFQAALYAGLRLAGPAGVYEEPAARFSRHLGVAFQILNDLEDGQADRTNKRSAGGDILGGRPTILWALALEALEPKRANLLAELMDQPEANEEMIARVRELYDEAGVRQTASDLVAKHAQRARDVADQVAPAELSRLLHYFVDVIIKV